MSTHSTATSESNSNGKRERDEDEEDEQLLREAPNYKKLVVTDATTGTAATSDDNESDRQALSDALAKENLEDNESSKTLSTEAEENPEESMNHDNHPKEPQQKDKEDAPTDTIGDETPSIETQHSIPTQTSEQQGPARDDTEQANPAAATPVESSNAPPPPQTSTNNNDDAAADSSSTKTSSSSAVHNTNTAPPPSSSSSSSSLPHPSVPQPSPAPGPSHSSTSFPHQQPPPPSRPVAPMQHQQQQTIQQPQPHSDEEIVERGQVPALYVGRVIGKGGEMIRDLQARSGARIDVDQNVPAGHPRVITYRGTRDTVEFAKRLVHLLSVENIDENDLPLGRASQEILVIPSQTVGKVIGRSGEMIRELQSRSRAKIQIDHSGRSGLPPEQKQVTITGTGEAVAKAKEMVLFLVANPSMEAQQSLNMLIEDKLRTGMPWGSGPPYPNMPNQGINMTPNNASPHFQGTPGGYFGQPPPSYGGGMVQAPGYMGGGMPPQGPAPPMAYGGVVPTIPGGGQLPPAAYGAPSGYPMSYGGRETELVYVSKQYMGRIIGGKGVTINDLQQRSACDIQINQNVAPGQDCEITIKGTRQGIESAKQMIQEIIEIGPGHPYAGGSGAGMAAGGGAYGVPYQQGYDPGAGYGAPYGQQASYAPQYGQPQPDMGGGAGVSGAGYHGGGGYHGANAVPQQYGGFPPPPQQQAAPPPPAALSFWKAATAPDGQLYYYNERTGETQWDKPVGMP